MNTRIYKKLCRKAVVILAHGFNFSQSDFINDRNGIPYVVIENCYEPFECSALEMLLEMMEIQDLECDVYTLKANARLIREAIKFIYIPPYLYKFFNI